MRGRGVLSMTVIVLLVGVAFATLGTAEDAPVNETPGDGPVEISSSVGTTTSQLQWSTTRSGDLAIRLELEFAGWESCGFQITSGGWMGDNQVFHYTGQDRDGRPWTAVTNDVGIAAHVATTSVRAGTLPGDLWVGQSTHGFTGTGSIDWLYTGFDLTPVNHPWTNGKSVTFDLQCTGPFTITGIQGGRTLEGFIPNHIDGGLGVTALGSTLNVIDSAAKTFSEPDVVLRFRNDPVHEAGLLQLNTPSGTASHILTGGTDVFLDGTAGTYRADLTRLAADSNSEAGLRTLGVMAGLQDVASLDDAANL